MKKRLMLGLLLSLVMPLLAKEKQETPLRKAFSNIGLSAGVSTTGINLFVATPLANCLTLRAGYTPSAPFRIRMNTMNLTLLRWETPPSPFRPWI